MRLRKGQLYRRHSDGYVFRVASTGLGGRGAFLQCVDASRVQGWFWASAIARDFDLVSAGRGRTRRDVKHETFAGDVWLARAAFGDRYCRAGLYTVWRGDTRLGTNLTLEQARALARRASSGRDRRRRLARRDEVRTTVTGRQASSSPLANPHDRVTGWRPAADGSLIHREWKDGVIVTNARAWDWAEVNEDERRHLAKRRRRR